MPGPLPRWLATALAAPSARRWVALLGLLVVAKVSVVVLRWLDGVAAGLRSPWAPPVLLRDDALFALGFLAVDLLLWRLLPARGAQRLGAGALVAVALYAAINVPVTRVFSTPLTHGLLVAAGGALSDSIRVYFTAANVLSVVTVLGVAAWLARPSAPAVPPRGVAVLIVASALVAAAGALGARKVDTLGLHRNAVVALIRSTAERRAPAAVVEGRPTSLPEEGPSLDLRHLSGLAAGRSVVWVVLESTGARYLKPWGAPQDATPRLSEMAGRGLVFPRTYAAYPESIRGLYAMLCASAPAAHRSAEQHGGRKVRCGSIAEVLSAQGYRTAMFHSGRFAYLGMDEVVAERGFQSLEDARTIGGRVVKSFGNDDASTVRKILSWIDGLRGERFFAMYLPIAGHHPYRAPGDGPRPFPEKSEQDRYLNDLFMGDAAMGALIDGIRARGLDERTLWVFVGDHGEAFQQHPGNFAHTMFIYEENVHVPLIFAAPGALGAGLRAPQIASVIDIAPTVLDLLGLPVPGAYQGRTLLSPDPGVALFCTDQTLFQVGLRQGPWKFLHEVESGRSSLYFLPDDGGEQRSVAAQHPDRVRRYREHLLGWVEAQRARVDGGRLGFLEGKEALSHLHTLPFAGQAEASGEAAR